MGYYHLVYAILQIFMVNETPKSECTFAMYT